MGRQALRSPPTLKRLAALDLHRPVQPSICGIDQRHLSSGDTPQCSWVCIYDWRTQQQTFPDVEVLL